MRERRGPVAALLCARYASPFAPPLHFSSSMRRPTTSASSLRLEHPLHFSSLRGSDHPRHLRILFEREEESTGLRSREGINHELARRTDGRGRTEHSLPPPPFHLHPSLRHVLLFAQVNALTLVAQCNAHSCVSEQGRRSQSGIASDPRRKSRPAFVPMLSLSLSLPPSLPVPL